MSKNAPGRKPSKDLLEKDSIVIDQAKGLVFTSEEELYDHFEPQIQLFEKEYFTHRADEDIKDENFAQYEELLTQVLDDPDEVWEDVPTPLGHRIRYYIGHFTSEQEAVFYVAVAYVTDDVPSFIFLHFPSRDIKQVERYRRGTMVYDRVLNEVRPGAVEGDALSEGDDLAVGLYKAMLKLRSKKDVPELEFKKFEDLRESTINDPDEIWRTNDLDGNILVSFLKEFSERGKNLHYIVVTIEDTPSSSHALLFSFPSKDSGLVDRYRHGENLQAEEVVQEASH